MHRQAREREAGDVDFLDRAARVLEPIDRRLGDELEACRTQLFEERAQRHALPGRQLFEVREREPRHCSPAGCGRDFLHPSDGGGAARRNAKNTQFACRCRTHYGRPHLCRDVRNAHERRVRAVPLPAEVVGEDAEGDDIVRSREGGQFCVSQPVIRNPQSAIRNPHYECKTVTL